MRFCHAKAFLVASILGVVTVSCAPSIMQHEEVVGFEFNDCDECPTMVVLPSGSFMMGHAPKEAKAKSNESPQHQVKISKPFAV